MSSILFGSAFALMLDVAKDVADKYKNTHREMAGTITGTAQKLKETQNEEEKKHIEKEKSGKKMSNKMHCK